jgi:hypothetical protein
MDEKDEYDPTHECYWYQEAVKELKKTAKLPKQGNWVMYVVTEDEEDGGDEEDETDTESVIF